MNASFRAARLLALALVALFALSGCITPHMYVQGGMPLLAASDFTPPTPKKPVQLLFEFRAKGSPNASATKQIRPFVESVANASGLFAAVSPTPADGGVLAITIDNVPLTDDVAAKGFGTGLTLGLVGTMVTDGYVCKATYTANGRTTQAEVKHAISTTIGNHAGPPGLTPMDPRSAVDLAMREITWQLLKRLADQHAFD